MTWIPFSYTFSKQIPRLQLKKTCKCAKMRGNTLKKYEIRGMERGTDDEL